MGWPGPMTHRQHLAWKAWLLEEWDRPSRSDYYAMQTAFHAQYSNRKMPSRMEFDKLRIKFRDQQPKADAKRIAAAAKMRWFAVTGYNG